MIKGNLECFLLFLYHDIGKGTLKGYLHLEKKTFRKTSVTKEKSMMNGSLCI